METLALILLVSMGPLCVAITTALTAKRTNVQWRERRAAKLAAASATADVVQGRAAH